MSAWLCYINSTVSTNNFLIWEDENFELVTPAIPHIPKEEGLHLVLTPKNTMPTAWSDPVLCGKTFGLAAKICQVIEKLGLAPWFNLQANGNWGLLPGKSPHFHVHIYARRKGKLWGKPLVLPEAPATFQNDPMADEERARLTVALKSLTA